MAQMPLTGFDYIENKISLVDCYRVALDFGLPAAQQALENFSMSLPQQMQSSKNANSHPDVSD
ncbi:MAG: hypothetical protein ACI9SC_000876 [Gammaproteobacteria bacterium]|jgi:hypothetical protein